MSIKDIIKKIHNAGSVQISISEDDWNLLGESASIVKLEGTLEEVNSKTLSFIRGKNLSAAETVAIVLFCNPEASLSMIGAIPTEEISKTGLKALYSICCNPIEEGKVEMYIIYK